MTTKDEALQMALDALEFSQGYLDELADAHGVPKKPKPGSTAWNVNRAITACREALAQKDEQEPVAWMLECPTQTGGTTWYLSWSRSGAGVCNRLRGECHEKPLYAAPPKRQPLTDEKLRAMWVNYAPIVGGTLEFARAIEQAHGIGAEK